MQITAWNMLLCGRTVGSFHTETGLFSQEVLRLLLFNGVDDADGMRFMGFELSNGWVHFDMTKALHDFVLIYNIAYKPDKFLTA